MRWWFGLFHYWAFIYLDIRDEDPTWKTNNRHPLNAQTLYVRWKRDDQIIGVRFATQRGGKTHHFALDIDQGSPYHPLNNEPEFKRLSGVLESIGLCRDIRVRSSDSGGIHLYYPLPDPVLCTKLSLAVHRTLEQNGFTIAAGKLELFPNLRSSSQVEYQGLRLPLQNGSYVLDNDWQPLHNDLERLIVTWQEVSSCQDMELLAKAIAHHTAKAKYTSKDIEEWKNRLETTIQEGWTDYGQTNRILQEFCVYARVFKRFDWDDIERWVLKTAVSLPGYQKYCRHQPDIKKRIKEWVKANRRSGKYCPLGSEKKKKIKTAPNNGEKSVDALQRIEQAIASISHDFSSWPDGVMERLKLLHERSGCNNNTLYKHKELWHPNFDGKVCVNPSDAKVSVVSKCLKNQGSDLEVCVNPCPDKVSAISQDSLKDLKSAESQSNQGFTHDSLQSVYSPKATQEKKSTFPTSLQMKVGDLVRQKEYGSTFRILEIYYKKGTVLAKPLNHSVPLVNAYWEISDLELINSSNTDQTARG